MIADAIKQAQRLQREVIEATYDGKCSVYQRRPVLDPKTKVTEYQEVEVLQDEPCHLYYLRTSSASNTDTVTAVPQTTKLFLEPEIEIEPGSKIVVTQQGVTGSYSQSGKAAVYSSHQEITLELFEGYA